MSQLELPYPQLALCERNGLAFLSDESLSESVGVRIAFTERKGGTSVGPCASLNLGTYSGDDIDAIQENRQRLLAAIGASTAELLVPNQVHGTDIILVDHAEGAGLENRAQDAPAAEDADGIIVTCSNVAALLCFADCMPVVLVAPDASFAVVHAGWRGVMSRIVPKALRLLCEGSQAAPSACNVYLGPYIHAECFEVDPDLTQRFADAFGKRCVPDAHHVDLGEAMRASLADAGANVSRIADADACTVCENTRFFSYRAQDGVCGRHGAIAVRVDNSQ